MKNTLLAGLALLAASVAPAFAQEPRTIDVILPLTGPAAFLGQAEWQALQQLEAAIASGLIKTLPVKFQVHDDQSSPQTAVQLATSLISGKPPVILGSGLVGMCNAMAPLMKKGPVMYCFSPGIHPPAGGFVFTASVSTRDLASSLIRFYRMKGMTRIALLTSTDASGQDAARNLHELLAMPENHDMVVTEDVRFNPGDVSVAAQIQRIKGSNPQAMIAWSTGAPIGTVFKAISEAGLDIPVATTDGNMTYAQMDQYKAFLPKTLYIPASQWMGAAPGQSLPPQMVAAQKAFFDAFKPIHVTPDSASTYAWDPAIMVLDALQALGPNATAEQVRERLAATKGWIGIKGAYDFVADPQRGLNENEAIVTQWSPEKHAWIPVSAPRGVPLGK
jgi:branched-chain amino acid transport system substrate-binding protein